MFNRPLHRFAIFTAASTFVLIFIGGLVTSTGSGLSVPDWPTTYGQNMFTYPIDKWVGGIQYEHGHRLFASFVGFLTVILTVWLMLKERRPWVKWFGVAALSAVILQGVLGGLTVLFLLPVSLSVAHGMLAQTFLCITIAIALFTSKWWIENNTPTHYSEQRQVQLFTILSVVVVFIQLILGAVMRHTYSGLAIPDYPLSYGQLFPTLTQDAVQQYNHILIQNGIRWAGDKQIQTYQIVIHLMHRFWAIVVGAVVLLSGLKIARSEFFPLFIRRNGLLMSVAVSAQFMLGILTVMSRKGVIITTLHVALGAFTLGICVLTLLSIGKVFGFRLTHSDTVSQ